LLSDAMVVIDTNVLAYLLIEGDRTSDAQALYRRDSEWRSEGFVLVEFSNVLATYLRAGALTRGQAQSLLSEGENRLRGLVTLPHRRALRLAEQFAVSAYDARFLGAAQTLGSKLVTEDARLRTAAPALTMSLTEALSS
jgi:predicted nucleic acid-binding protein